MELPRIGLGCAPRPVGSVAELRRLFDLALDLGYRLFDTAEVYGTESVLGESLRRRGSPPRDRLFIVSKVWQTNHAHRDVVTACEQTLGRLGLSYLDLYLVHSPEAWRHVGPLGDLAGLGLEEIAARARPVDSEGHLLRAEVSLGETWDAMRELEGRGLVRAIGVSNFTPEHLEELAGDAPRVHQIEHHPLRRQADLVRFCRDRGICVMAHSPLSAAGLLRHPRILGLAAEYSRTPSEIVLRWNLEHGVTPIPGTVDPSHLRQNLGILDFALRLEDVAALDALDPA